MNEHALAIAAIGLAVPLHIWPDEHRNDFHGFYNEVVHGSTYDSFPVSRAKNFWVDKLGLSLLGVGLALVAALWSLYALAGLMGHLCADSVQHFIHWSFYRGRRRIIPGWWSTVVFLVPAAIAAAVVLRDGGGFALRFFWLAFIAGATLVPANHVKALFDKRGGR